MVAVLERGKVRARVLVLVAGVLAVRPSGIALPVILAMSIMLGFVSNVAARKPNVLPKGELVAVNSRQWQKHSVSMMRSCPEYKKQKLQKEERPGAVDDEDMEAVDGK